MDRGWRVLVVDKRSHIGGNVYTETVEGIHVHRYGAHIFHTNRDHIWDYVQRFARFNRFTNSPMANYKGELYSEVSSKTVTKIVEAPVIAGETPFDSSTEVTITAAEGASIYYTNDGTTPTSGSTAYSEALTLEATTTIKAIAVKGGITSEVASKTFTKNE